MKLKNLKAEVASAISLKLNQQYLSASYYVYLVLNVGFCM